MLNDVFLGLQKRIMVPLTEFKHFDWFNGQYEINEQGKIAPFPMPAVFVEFLPYKPKSLARRIQMAELNFRLHLVSDNYSFSQFGMTEQPTALAHLDLCNKLNFLIHCHNYIIPADEIAGIPARAIYNTCSKVSNESDHRQTNIIVNILEYRTLAYDYSALRPTTNIKPAPPLSIIPEI